MKLFLTPQLAPQELLRLRLPHSVHVQFWRAAFKPPAWTRLTNQHHKHQGHKLIDQCVNDHGLHCFYSVRDLMRFANQQAASQAVLTELDRIEYSHGRGNLHQRAVLMRALTNGNLHDNQLIVARRWLRKLDIAMERRRAGAL